MPKFIKTVTVEKLDVNALIFSAEKHNWLTYGRGRVVMSPRTKDAIAASTPKVILAPGSEKDEPANTYLCGCTIDTNDALPFGEVLFTMVVET